MCPESKVFALMAYFQPKAAVLHVVYGTLASPSVISIGMIDATAIVARFFASTCICSVAIRRGLAQSTERRVETVAEDSENSPDTESASLQRHRHRFGVCKPPLPRAYHLQPTRGMRNESHFEVRDEHEGLSFA
jgi:hypothetical protein